MFFALIFLILTALGAWLFPEWSWVAILGAAFGCVVTLRLLLFLTERSGKSSGKNTDA